MEIIILASAKLNETPCLLIFFLIKACAQDEVLRGVSLLHCYICLTLPFQRPGELLDGFQGSAIMYLIKYTLVGIFQDLMAS